MTSTDIATTTQAGNGIARALPGIMPDVTSEALDRLARWVDAASHAHKLVAPLIGTPWVPAAYQPKVDPRASDEEKQRAYEVAVANGTAAVLYGSSLGIDPLMALQQVYVVHGRPGLYAKMMVALVQSRGHEVWTEDISDTRAVVCGRRKGSSHTERVTITMDMARKAKWTANQKYTETPQDMLWARAAGRVCDRIASDVLKGISTVEQIEDETISAGTASVGSRTVTPRKRAAAAALPSAHDLAQRDRSDYDPEEDEPPLPAAEAEPVDIGDAPQAITDEQRATLSDLLAKTGRRAQTPARNFLAGVLGRKVSAPTDLTSGEAEIAIAKLLAELENNQAEPGDEEPELPL